MLWGEGYQTLECIRSKGAEEIELLLLNGKAYYFPSWQDKHETFSDFIDPNWLDDTRDRSRLNDTLPNRECYKLRGESDDVDATVEVAGVRRG